MILTQSCLYKNVINQYPYGYSGNPAEAADMIEIQRISEYFYIDQKSGERVSLDYSNGALQILSELLKTSEWSKHDSFQNPITQQSYKIRASASYNPEFNADEFLVNLIGTEADTTIGFIEGLVEDATVYVRDVSFRFTALEYWEPKVKKEKVAGENVWNHYPFGGSWSFEINGSIAGEVVQGSPVVKKFGVETNSGESFTFLFIEETERSMKAYLINAWMVYLALSDMEYYYYECDYSDPYDQDCPGSVIVR